MHLLPAARLCELDDLDRQRFPEIARRVVKRDVTVRADADDQQVDSPRLLNRFVVIIGVSVVRKVNTCRRDIHVIEESLPHVGMKTLRMLLGQTAILIQIECSQLGEIEMFLTISPYEIFIHA